MKDYKQISSQVDIFLGSIDPISIEHQFSKNPKVCFKKSLQKISEFIREKVYSQFPSSTSNLGRKAFDPMFMMQVIIVARRFGFSDQEMSDALKSDLLIMYLLGIKTPHPENMPSGKTIWSYREDFEKKGLFKELFSQSIAMNISSNQETIENEDIIIDSSFNVAPRQRNTRDENKLIKEGKGGELWLDNKYKKRQKDIDATWTKKRNETFYGYKAHVKCGAISKVILEVYTTNASTHDSQVILPLLHPNDVNKKLYLDAGYSGAKSLSTIKNELHIEPIVCEKGRRNKPLTDAQKKSNRIKSKTRCLIEHVFGFIEQSMKGFVVRTIGKIRAESNNYLTCAVYNISRWLQLISAPSQPT